MIIQKSIFRPIFQRIFQTIFPQDETASNLLMEDGFNLLQEDGGLILL